MMVYSIKICSLFHNFDISFDCSESVVLISPLIDISNMGGCYIVVGRRSRTRGPKHLPLLARACHSAPPTPPQSKAYFEHRF